MDVDARMQLFDLKTKYQFQTQPGVDQYNMPLYDVQTEPGNQTIGMFPVYQGFLDPVYVNGVQIQLQTQKSQFYNYYPTVTQNFQTLGVGDGVTTQFTLNIPVLNNSVPLNPPVMGLLRGHVDITGIIATGFNIDPPISIPNFQTTIPTTSVDSKVFITSLDALGNSIVVQDSGQFLPQINYGLLMSPGKAPFGNSALIGGYSTVSNTINYITGQIIVNFPTAPANGANINVQCLYIQSGLPRSMLYNNNTITLRAPPDRQYLVELDAYLSPAAFLQTNSAIPFGYMAEYIARGAARKILSDTGDIEQFQFYEPLFVEQELLVWKRSQRQFTATRTHTLYSQGMNQGCGNNNFGTGNF